METDTAALQRIISDNSPAIVDFCSGKSASFPDEAVALVLNATRDAVDSESLHLKAFLPLCDALVGWRSSRLPASSSTSPSPALIRLDADIAFIEITTALGKNLTKYGRLEQLLDEQAWARGERLRLLAPLGALTAYGCDRKGMERHLSRAGTACGPLVQAMAAGLDELRIVALTLQRIASGDTELVAAQRSIADVSKAMQAMNNATEWVLAALPQLPAETIGIVLKTHQHVVGSALPDGQKRQTANRVWAPLLVALMQKIATSGPGAGQMSFLSEDVLGALMQGSNDICYRATTFRMPSPGTLARAARRVDEEAKTASGYRSWLCRCVSLGLNTIDLRFGGTRALESVAAAYLALMAHPTDWAPVERLEAQLEHDVDWAARSFVDGVIGALTSQASPNGNGSLSLDCSPDPNPTLYMRNLRCANAVLVAVPHIDADDQTVANNTAMVLTFFLSGVRSCRPSGRIAGDIPADLAPTASQLARTLAANSCRAALLAMTANPPMLAVGARNASRQDSASFFVHCTLWALYEVCLLASAASQHADAADALPRRQAAALVLRVLHILERLGPVRDMTLENAPLGSPWHVATALDTEDMGQLRCLVAGLEDVLVPTLTPTTVAALQWLAQAKGIVDEGVTISRAAAAADAAAARRLNAMAADAEGVDPKDEAVQVARARILGSVADCAFTMCPTMRPPTPDGDVTAKEFKLKSCSGCRVVRYCSASHQKIDWKIHKISCRAIQKEAS